MSEVLVERKPQRPKLTLRGIPFAPPPKYEPPAPPPRRRKLEGTELLSRYVVENVIGEGGMATVYRGRHATIQKAVAIKVLDAALDSVPDAVERFLQEAQVTSRVVHENVVEVTDFGTTADGVVFCVMELLQGQTLAQLIASSAPLPVPRAAAILRQVCSALQAAHERGIIHRDLKPENCFRTPRTSNSDFIKLLDFGIARVAGDGGAEPSWRAARPHRTQVGCVVGTPDYMAPEQARAEPFDHRVDVYAAGCLLYELLTGVPPYPRGNAAELMASHIDAPIPDPRELVPSLCPAIAEVVQTAMAKRPEDRHPDMAALADAIARAVSEQQRPASPRWLQHRRAVLVGAAAAGAIVIAFTTSAMHSTPPAAIAMSSLAAERHASAPTKPAAASAPPVSPWALADAPTEWPDETAIDDFRSARAETPTIETEPLATIPGEPAMLPAPVVAASLPRSSPPAKLRTKSRGKARARPAVAPTDDTETAPPTDDILEGPTKSEVKNPFDAPK